MFVFRTIYTRIVLLQCNNTVVFVVTITMIDLHVGEEELLYSLHNNQQEKTGCSTRTKIK